MYSVTLTTREHFKGLLPTGAAYIFWLPTFGHSTRGTQVGKQLSNFFRKPRILYDGLKWANGIKNYISLHEIFQVFLASEIFKKYRYI